MNDLASLYPLLPEGVLALTILVVISVDLFLARENKWWLTPLTVVGLGLDRGGHRAGLEQRPRPIPWPGSTPWTTWRSS